MQNRRQEKLPRMVISDFKIVQEYALKLVKVKQQYRYCPSTGLGGSDCFFYYYFFFVGQPHEDVPTEEHPGNLTILMS